MVQGFRKPSHLKVDIREATVSTEIPGVQFDGPFQVRLSFLESPRTVEHSS